MIRAHALGNVCVCGGPYFRPLVTLTSTLTLYLTCMCRTIIHVCPYLPCLVSSRAGSVFFNLQLMVTVLAYEPTYNHMCVWVLGACMGGRLNQLCQNNSGEKLYYQQDTKLYRNCINSMSSFYF